MASINSVTGSKMAGCPVVANVSPGSVGENAVFHRVRLIANVSGTEFQFSSAVSGNEAVSFDVSSALMAVLEKRSYQAGGMSSYPSVTLSLTAYDDYIIDGEEHYGENGSTFIDGGAYYNGALSDKERLYGAPSRYSRKPFTTPEIAFVGTGYVVAGEYASAPQSYLVIANAGVQTVRGATFYGIPKPQDGYEIRFINGLGVHENVFINCLRKGEVNITTERFVIARQETLSNFSRAISLKKNDHERWRMSTHPIDHDWQQWYLHEFLMARWAWVNVGGKYYQVHILPEETTAGIDRASGKPITVEFTIEFDINGSPFL